MTDKTKQASYPYQAPIDAYGNGGFRFAEMSHRGALLCLPTGIFEWTIKNPAQLEVSDFQQIFDNTEGIQFLLLGTGPKQIFPSLEVRKSFENAKLGLDSMDTGAACRTYNVLLAEKRAVAAALLPVE